MKVSICRVLKHNFKNPIKWESASEARDPEERRGWHLQQELAQNESNEDAKEVGSYTDEGICKVSKRLIKNSQMKGMQ